MITRKGAQKKALACANEMIKKNGGESVAFASPRKGKCSWTWNEYKEAVLNDRCLLDERGREIKGTNPVDDMYNYLVYAQEHRLPSSKN